MKTDAPCACRRCLVGDRCFSDPDARGRKDVTGAAARALVAGFTVLNDVTARKLQGQDRDQSPGSRDIDFFDFLDFLDILDFLDFLDFLDPSRDYGVWGPEISECHKRCWNF